LNFNVTEYKKFTVRVSNSTLQLTFKKTIILPGVMMHLFSPSTWEAEAGGSGVSDWPAIRIETLSQKFP
jgi:hypothetical protein